MTWLGIRTFSIVVTAWSAAAVGLSALAAQQTVEFRIRAAAGDPTRVEAVFEELCDLFAPRLTGSDALEAAAERCRAAFAALGLDARVETWELPVTWRPGPARVRVLEPIVRDLEAVGAGWSPPTDGLVEAPLAIGSDGVTEGRAVLLDLPLDAARDGSARPHPAADAAACLVDGGRPWAAVPAIPAPFAAPGVAATVPTVAIAAEDAAWLRRLAARGAAVRVAVEIGGELGPARAVPELVADLPGRDAEAEVVLAIAGLDTWHRGAGAVATGTDVAVLLETARLLRAAEARPRRTIRFVLLTGTQQGFGTAAYARRNAAALDRHAGGLVLEGGSGSVTGVQLAGHAEALPIAERWFEPVAALGATDVGLRTGDGPLPKALQRRGVPVYAVARPAPIRDLLRGTQADVPDRVAAEEMERAAVVLATALWRLADAEATPPRFPTER